MKYNRLLKIAQEFEDNVYNINHYKKKQTKKFPTGSFPKREIVPLTAIIDFYGMEWNKVNSLIAQDLGNSFLAQSAIVQVSALSEILGSEYRDILYVEDHMRGDTLIDLGN